MLCSNEERQTGRQIRSDDCLVTSILARKLDGSDLIKHLSVVSPLSELVTNQLSIQIFGRSLSKLNIYSLSTKMINVMFFVVVFPDHFDPIKKVNLGLKKLPVMFLKTHSRVFKFLASFYYWKSVMVTECCLSCEWAF